MGPGRVTVICGAGVGMDPVHDAVVGAHDHGGVQSREGRRAVDHRAGAVLESLRPVDRVERHQIAVHAHEDRAVGSDRGRGAQHVGRVMRPLQRPRRSHGIDEAIVGPEIDDAARGHGGGAVLDLSPGGRSPAQRASGIQRVKIRILRAEEYRAVRSDRRGRPDGVAGRIDPFRVPRGSDRIQFAVVRPEIDGAVGADVGRGPDRAAGVIRPAQGAGRVHRVERAVGAAHVDRAVGRDGRCRIADRAQPG